MKEELNIPHVSLLVFYRVLYLAISKLTFQVFFLSLLKHLTDLPIFDTKWQTYFGHATRLILNGSH